MKLSWGDSWRQQLRLLPLYWAIRSSVRTKSASDAVYQHPWRAGLSVLIPERGGADLLTKTLASLQQALIPLNEPIQVLVIVNGSPQHDYQELRTRYPNFSWLFFPQPLGFSGAIHVGLEKAQHDWVYLLNSDMVLQEQALAEVLAHRSDEVFAIASQIFFADQNRRREETGLTGLLVNWEGVQIYDRLPVNDKPRTMPFAGGGASLFRTAALRRYVADSHCYNPFYWEDVEWGWRARKDGLVNLFCPNSKAVHIHRATIKQFYDEQEINRIWRRNALWFDLRNHGSRSSADQLLEKICAEPHDSQREFSRLSDAWRARKIRSLATKPVQAKIKLSSSIRKKLLLVTPFAIYPPKHGGARRIAGLIPFLAEHYEIILLSDEGNEYDAVPHDRYAYFHAIHLVWGRPDTPTNTDRLTRLHAHCHKNLLVELERVLDDYQPDLVQVEFTELAALIEHRRAEQKWVLGLHDVNLGQGGQNRADAVERAYYARFDSVTACSPEDLALVDHPQATLVPNGTALRLADYRPSKDSTTLVFMGPFRYHGNFASIAQFLTEAYPQIHRAVPQVELHIYAGEGWREKVKGDARFQQSGVKLFEHVDDIRPVLDQAALTLNTQQGNRGSALKVIESLTAGRCCISTVDGARGFAGYAPSALITVQDSATFAEPIISLLQNPQRRIQIEKPDSVLLTQFQWPACAQIQLNLYDSLFA